MCLKSVGLRQIAKEHKSLIEMLTQLVGIEHFAILPPFVKCIRVNRDRTEQNYIGLMKCHPILCNGHLFISETKNVNTSASDHGMQGHIPVFEAESSRLAGMGLTRTCALFKAPCEQLSEQFVVVVDNRHLKLGGGGAGI